MPPSLRLPAFSASKIMYLSLQALTASELDKSTAWRSPLDFSSIEPIAVTQAETNHRLVHAQSWRPMRYSVEDRST
jgi:hypothetical protein